MNFLKGFVLILLISFTGASSEFWIVSASVEGGSDIVNVHNPRMGWQLATFNKILNATQTAYQIIVASSEERLQTEEIDLWDTKKVHSAENSNIRYEGKLLAPGQRAYWAVRVWDRNDKDSDYCQGSWMLEFGVTQWKALWIGAPKNVQQDALKEIQLQDKEIIRTHPGLKPVLYFRKTFYLTEPVKRATIYCSAKGMFKGYLSEETGLHNGNIWPGLTPGWTNYQKTIQYHSFDVTYVLNQYRNHTIGMMVGTGWYSGYIGPGNNHSLYGNEEKLLFELHVEFFSGSKMTIKSDETWKVTTGPIIYSDLLHGETFYENRQLYDWLNYYYNDSNWSPVVTNLIEKNIELVSDSVAPYVSTNPLIFCSNYWKVNNDTWIYEFPKLVTGQLNLRISDFPYTARIQVRYAESIYQNRTLNTENHRSALVTDTFLLNDAENRPNFIFVRPSFTYHSFKYVEISGFPVHLNILNEIHGFDFRQINILSKFYTDNLMIGAFMRIIGSSEDANFISISTNSPSKDQRLGWLEPAGLFSLSAMYSGRADKFYKKWLKDVREAQASSGAFSNVAPKIIDESDAGPGSGSAPLMVTYNLYKMYGDITSVEENYESNQKWLRYVRSSNPDFLFTRNVGNNYGDFANVNAATPKEVIATAYFAYDALLMSFMAKALGKKSDEHFYEQLHKHVSNAFIKAYVNSTDGRIKGDTQTAYVVALAFKILPEELISKAVHNLVDNIKNHEYHLTTGYVGTAFILPVLCDHGHSDIAYKLLLQDSFPSWGYMLKNNATNIWERWDSWTEEKGFQDSSLNSLALGSVGSWFYQYMAGIDTDDQEVGFKKIIIKPHIGPGVNKASAIYITNIGLISSEWALINDTFNIKVQFPPNTKGKIILPFTKDLWEKELGSGVYEFEVPLK